MTGFRVVSLRKTYRYWRLLLAAFLVGIEVPAWFYPAPTAARGGTPPDVVFAVHTRIQAVALTFDDGPNPALTPKILAILKNYHARATFFVIGRSALAYPALVRQEVGAGMEVGNHTWGHINLAQHSQRQDVSDLERANQAIRSVTGQVPVLMRPPYGAYNPTVLRAARSLHLRTVLWSWTEDSRDWTNPGVQAIVNRVLAHIQPGDIVLFHDGGSSRQTVRAMPIILRDLTARGYRMVTVSSLLNMAGR